MAQNQTDKRRDIASRLVAGKAQIYAGLIQMEEAGREKLGAGVVWAQADFDGTNLQHLTPTIADNAIGTAEALRAWLISSGNHTNLELL